MVPHLFLETALDLITSRNQFLEMALDLAYKKQYLVAGSLREPF
jgi:hypothetical protein